MTKPKIKVLLVEDSLITQVAQKSSLENEGCEVDIATTGAQAITLAVNNYYDIIFMDIGLGDIDGFATAKEIRNRSSKNKTIPIIALTACSPEDYEIHAIESSMNGFLTKPLTAEKVQYFLNQFCFH